MGITDSSCRLGNTRDCNSERAHRNVEEAEWISRSFFSCLPWSQVNAIWGLKEVLLFVCERRAWLFSSPAQHIVPGGHYSLASIDAKGQAWLANAPQHISADFGSPPPPAPVNQELMKGNLWHMRFFANTNPWISFQSLDETLNASLPDGGALILKPSIFMI